MEFKIWIYVIIAVIYVISRALKSKKEETPSQTPPSNYNPSTPASGNTTGKRQLTFEELLKEIAESKTSQPRPQSYDPTPTPASTYSKPKPAYVDYDDNLGREERDLEDVNYDYRKKDTIYKTYENAKNLAFNKPSLEETMKLENTSMEYERFKGFSMEKKQNLLDEYIKELRTPTGFKKAIVLNEILNRRF